MIQMEFSWDYKKNEANKRKHGISFEEAKTVFYDPNALVIRDPDHSYSEERFIMLGLSMKLRILIVCHCYRKKETLIRIISARKATKREQIQYKGSLT